MAPVEVLHRNLDHRQPRPDLQQSAHWQPDAGKDSGSGGGETQSDNGRDAFET
jgi:hypothetical protein